jgi:hypothetical protein
LYDGKQGKYLRQAQGQHCKSAAVTAQLPALWRSRGGLPSEAVKEFGVPEQVAKTRPI